MLQIVRHALTTSVVLYVFIGESTGHYLTSPPDRIVYFALILVALTTVGMIFAVRRLFILRSEAVLVLQPGNTAALRRWRSGYVVTYALCAAVALFGLLLRIMGFALSEVVPFYLGGFVLMLLVGPRRQSNEIG
jgi:hypothetical protein